MITKFITLGLLPIFLLGCASTQRIAESDKANVTAVTVSKTVAVPAEMLYLGPGGANAFALGAVGAALGAPNIEADRTSFQRRALASGKAIDSIVYDEAVAQIRQSGKFPLKDVSEQGGATIYVSVLNYGFSIPHGFSSKLVPTLQLRYELKDASGRVLWSATDRTGALGNPVEAIDADEVKGNAAVRDAAWREAARFLAVKLVSTY